jgi:hypothetical protein
VEASQASRDRAASSGNVVKASVVLDDRASRLSCLRECLLAYTLSPRDHKAFTSGQPGGGECTSVAASAMIQGWLSEATAAASEAASGIVQGLSRRRMIDQLTDSESPTPPGAWRRFDSIVRSVRTVHVEILRVRFTMGRSRRRARLGLRELRELA